MRIFNVLGGVKRSVVTVCLGPHGGDPINQNRVLAVHYSII